MKNKTLQRKDFLQLLAKSRSAKQRKQLIDKATRHDINAISECSLNLLKNKIPLNKLQYRKLYKCKHDIRKLASKSNSMRKKKDIIEQRGGFLSTLLPLAITAITALIHKIQAHKQK